MSQFHTSVVIWFWVQVHSLLCDVQRLVVRQPRGEQSCIAGSAEVRPSCWWVEKLELSLVSALWGGFFDSCVKITALEVSIILQEVKVLSWTVLPLRREHKFGRMRSTEYNAQKKKTASVWGCWGWSAGSRVDTVWDKKGWGPSGL